MSRQDIPEIACFAFNRPKHLAKVLNALGANALASESHITVYCDGPRNDQDVPLVEAVKSVARSVKGFRSVNVMARDRNLGCAASVIAGVTESFERTDKLVVFEDDVLASSYTLRYLDIALRVYEAKPAVFSISAWSPPPSLLFIPDEYPFDGYFVPRCNVWGWGTWRDRWQTVDWAVHDYAAFRKNKALRSALNQGGEDLGVMLDMQMAGHFDTWDIRMDYSRFKSGRVSLNPVRSYTTNIGMGSGTHTTQATSRYDNDTARAVADPRLPEHVFVDAAILKGYQKVYAMPGLATLVVNKIWRTFRGRNLIVR